MSNRGRQNVASFLTKDCKIDWRLGAEFFESHLIDYEVRRSLLHVSSGLLGRVWLTPFCFSPPEQQPSNNWGNWQYVAGVGNDPRASRQFNPIKQGNDVSDSAPPLSFCERVTSPEC